MQTTAEDFADPAKLAALAEKLDDAVARLGEAQPFAKPTRRAPVLDLARRLIAAEGGIDVLYGRVARLEEAGIFEGTDWASPEILHAATAARTLRVADTATTVLECLSEIRLLAVAQQDYFHPRIAAEQAQHFLSQAVGLNLNLLLGATDEAARARPPALEKSVRNLYRYIVERIGYGAIVDQVIGEIWRLLAQRPIVVDDVKTMVTQISVWLAENEVERGGAGWGADRLISAVFGPTTGCREDPGLDVYEQRISTMDAASLGQEASGFGRSMHDTGLVSPYHAVFMRWISRNSPDLVASALGLSSTGLDGLRCYQGLVRALIDRAIHPETCQAILGLALMLERGILYMPSIGPGLWRQIGLPLSPAAAESIAASFGTARPPEVFLLAGVLSMLGQPLGIGQGNNPTCQSARAMSMWAYSDPDYLLQVVTWAARDGEVVIHFEGQPISSRNLQEGLAALPPADVDPVSVVAVPHLDRIYAEMGRRCAGRGEDPHRWINPELHGWWVGRDYRIAVDVATGQLTDHEGFVRRFYGVYHPFYNGNQPVIHPQPAGLAVTDSAGRFIGWHAIAIYRVAIDQDQVMRVYFFNPNNDSGQDWGNGVVVSTEGHGERFGESSLPIAEFVSRLYLFHFDPLEQGTPDAVPPDEVARVTELARNSWASDR